LVNDATIGDDYINSNAIFGGADHLITSQNFKGGEAMALFGGVELDLRDAKISPDGCKLHATALFGGVEITVPSDWKVNVTGTPIFGGVENKSRGKEGDPQKEINLRCTVAFGGIEIK
jgi:predicted membrane protein